MTKILSLETLRVLLSHSLKTMKHQIAGPLDDLRIASKRVFLRPLQEADAIALYDAVRESRRELGEWLDWCRSSYELPEALGWIGQTRAPAFWRTCQNFGIFFNGSTSLLVGCVGLSNIDFDASSANLGYWIRTSQHGQGLAREAAAVMVKYANTTLALNRVEIAVHPLNEPSARVARALGAMDEGVRASRIVYRGSLAEARVYSLVKS